jgi:putative resolvase
MVEERSKVLGITEAAELLGISPTTLRRWVEDGTVKAVKLPSGHRRFEVSEIERKRRELGFSEAD